MVRVKTVSWSFNLIPVCGGLKSHLQKWTCSVHASHIIISYRLPTCPKQAWAIHTVQQGKLQFVTSLKPGHSRTISHWFPISSTTLYVETKSGEILAQFAAKLMLNAGATNKWDDHSVFHNCSAFDGQNPTPVGKVKNHCNQGTCHKWNDAGRCLWQKKLPQLCCWSAFECWLKSLPHTSPLFFKQPSGIQVPKMNLGT